MTNGWNSIKLNDLTDTTTPGQIKPGTNGNEAVLHTPKRSKTGALPLGAVSTISRTFLFLGHLKAKLNENLKCWYFRHASSNVFDDWPYTIFCLIIGPTQSSVW